MTHKMKLKNIFWLTIGLCTIVILSIYIMQSSTYERLELGYAKEDMLGLPKISYPDDNLPTKDKIALGRKLFMDRRLSHNNTISCAMCHVPEQGFTVNEIATAVGIEGRSNRRNAPTIFNVGYQKLLFHDGREFSLENQVLGPLVAFNEMGNPSVGYVIEKIKKLPDYNKLFENAFDRPVDIDLFNKAIATYERTLVSGNSRFDQWYYGKNNKALNESETRGFKLFTGKARCVICHTITKEDAIFTDQSFHNTGIGWARNNKVINRIYSEPTFSVTLAPGVVVQVEQNLFDKVSEAPQNDVGRFEVTEDPKDSWAYKTPSIRNIEITGPYMHDGSLITLEDVVDFYNKGGEDNPYKDSLLKRLGLTQTEKEALVSFLKTLTGSNVKRLEIEARSQ
jgi:cytochrome c peroxidase